MHSRPVCIAWPCVLFALLAGCAKSLDTKKLEKVMVKGLNERLAPLALSVKSVACPQTVPMRQGESFECSASFEGGGLLAVNVDQKDDEGNVVYRIKQEIVAASKVEQSIAQMLADKSRVQAAVNCGNRVYPSVPKTTFQCAATDTAGDVLVFDVTIKDEHGNVGWKLAEK